MLRARESVGGLSLAERMRCADTHWARMRGLLGTRELPAGEGLWIRPCQQVHMFGMGYALDIVFLDEHQGVVHTESALQPWKLSPKVQEARSVIELPVGTIERVGLRIGSRVEIEGEPDPARAAWFDTASAIVCNLLLAAVYSFFAAAHLRAVHETGYWSMTLPFVAQESMLVALFLTRRRSFGTTGNVIDWLVGIAGTFLPLFLRPTGAPGTLAAVGAPIQLVGFLLAIFGLMSLGRSVGIVAANRGVQTQGFYKVVRHPMYVSYMLTYVGYTMCYPTPRNLALVCATFVFLVLRVRAEERFLRRDPVYRDYSERVPWRFVPYLF